MIPLKTGLRWFPLGLLISSLLPCRADVTLDGTMGPAGALAGPDFQIGAELGHQVGSNLFHSFGVFNVNTGESATFTGPPVIDNVLSRVTGSSQSFIDGLLRSAIESANLWFINPSGVLFDPNASLDVNGSFHVSTADYLRLADGGRFEATNPENSVLTTAPPEAFGFLDDTPAPITVDRSTLVGQESETLSLVGGDILMQGGTLSAPSGRINLASVASAGLAVLADGGLQMAPLREGAEIQRGDIRISQGSRIEVSGSGGMGVFIRGGRFTLEGGSEIKTLTTSADKGGDISVKAMDAILVAGSGIRANTFGDGKAGKIDLEARTIRLDGSRVESRNGRFDDEFNPVVLGQGDTAPINISAAEEVSMSRSRIGNSTFSSGDAGNISIEAGSLELIGDLPEFFTGRFTEISSYTPGPGNAGTITVKARDTIKMSGLSLIRTSTVGEGDAGTISIEAGSLELMDSFNGISSDSFGPGNVGTVDIKVRDTIKMSNSLIGTSAEGGSDAGNLSIEAGSLEVMDNSLISSNTLGPGNGNGGTIEIKARDTIKMSSSEICTSTSGGEGDAGNIFIEAGSLLMDDSIFFSESIPLGIDGNFFLGQGNSGTIDIKVRDTIKMSDFSAISTSTTGEDDAGNIFIEAGSLESSMFGGIFSASSTFFGGGQGNSGTIDIKVRDTIKMSDFSAISTSTEGEGDAGEISIEARSLELMDRSIISSESGDIEDNVGGGQGNSGTIDIKARDTIVLSGPETRITTSTLGSGAGGAIRIDATDIELSNGGTISAESSGTGLAGQIFIKALDNLRLVNGSQISVETTQANAGDIDLKVGKLLYLRDSSSITTSVAGGQGDGGNIFIDPVFTVLDGGSEIVAQAQEGRGGNIRITSDFFFQSPDSLVDASSGNPALSGTVEIDSPDTDITGGVTALPESFFDAATVLATPCAERSGAEVSRLVIRRYEVLPDSPYALRVQLPQAVLGATDRAADERDIPSMRVHPSLAFTCPDDG